MKTSDAEDRDLALYAEGVRMRIKTKNGLYFPNNSDKKTVIVLREFINCANRNIRIFCKEFSKNIYNQLREDFLKALFRGVRIQILTEMKTLSACELAKLLKEGPQSELAEFHHLETKTEIAHFSIFDGNMFRLELNQNTKEAMVCACADSGDAREKALLLEDVYDILWEDSSNTQL